MDSSPIRSVNAVLIRLPDERWDHICEEHAELVGRKNEVLQTVHAPERVVLGNDGELLAIREVEIDKWMVVVYRELESDGFIITAFLTRRIRSINRRKQIWP
ncbi:MAG TPA: hypothetical protein PLQ56_16885 [Aggregatilineales bacterium]|nr:hypothetical protein [Aggregatilineales bacterium]